jgi:hypothetical protein
MKKRILALLLCTLTLLLALGSQAGARESLEVFLDNYFGDLWMTFYQESSEGDEIPPEKRSSYLYVMRHKDTLGIT